MRNLEVLANVFITIRFKTLASFVCRLIVEILMDVLMPLMLEISLVVIVGLDLKDLTHNLLTNKT